MVLHIQYKYMFVLLFKSFDSPTFFCRASRWEDLLHPTCLPTPSLQQAGLPWVLLLLLPWGCLQWAAAQRCSINQRKKPQLMSLKSSDLEFMPRSISNWIKKKDVLKRLLWYRLFYWSQVFCQLSSITKLWNFLPAQMGKQNTTVMYRELVK